DRGDGFVGFNFRKRYRSSYETPSSSSSPALPVRKRYRGTFELILDTDSGEDEIREECWELKGFYKFILLEGLNIFMAGEDEFHDDNPPPPPPVPPTQQAPHTLSTIKLLILKKGEYDIWAMKMEHYLSHTDYL
ncbi:hypothetical protein Tco_0095231, partial [Tanacetum coccineum]